MPKVIVVSKMKKFIGDKSHNTHMKEIGIGPATYFSWLAGRRMPGKKYHRSLENSFGVSINLLFPQWVEVPDEKPIPPKACPFCRSPKHQVITDIEVECKKCGCRGPAAGSSRQAVILWNLRPKAIG